MHARVLTISIISITCSLLGDQQVPMLAQAQQYQQEGNIQAAINTFEAILAQEPTNADVHFEYGSFLAGLDQQRYYEKAATHMQVQAIHIL